MKIVQGDLIEMAEKGDFDVILHGCNCFCQMGSGIALQIKQKFPTAYLVDSRTVRGSKKKLGTITQTTTKDGLIVVNAYTQFNYGKGKRYADYDAIRNCMKLIKLNFSGKKIGYPKIGAGLAGGDWKIIEQIIDEELEGMDHTLVEYVQN